MSRRFLFIIVTVFAACTGLRGYDDAVFACDDDAQCASGFVCITGRCARPGTVNAACESSEDCASPLLCDRAKCREAGSNGTSCDDGSQCGSSVCASGVCCAAACDGPCSTCETGSCEALPAGARGRCSDFACTGSSAWCGNTCTPETTSTTCVSGHLCRQSVCIACAGSLHDTFTSLSSAWQSRGNGTISAGDGGLTFTLQGTGGFSAVVLSSVTPLPLDGCSFSVDIAEPGNLSGGFFTAVQARGAADGALLGFRLDAQGLRSICRISNGQPCPTEGRVFRSSAAAYPRLRVSVTGGHVEWRGVVPGESDVLLGEEDGVVLPGNVLLELMTGTEQSTGSTTARIAGVNVDAR